MPPAAPILTPRLLLRPPTTGDAAMIFQRYAADAEVTRLLTWPRHERIGDTDAFLKLSASEWARWPAGPLLIESRADGRLLGSTGLGFEAPDRAFTGYVLARDAQGFGYASEALRAMVALAQGLAVTRLYAMCHPSNLASIRVLERGGFTCEGLLPTRQVFPNLGSEPQDVASYAYDRSHQCPPG
jgi:ribosomal-protein-alanine N-acetyltransferase